MSGAFWGDIVPGNGGQSTFTIWLNRIYDMSLSGRYTITASSLLFRDSSTRAPITSNTVHITMEEPKSPQLVYQTRPDTVGNLVTPLPVIVPHLEVKF